MRAEVLRNSFANFLGGALPALVTIVTLPIIVSGLGEDAYGIFALIVAIVGYFAIIDINITAGSVKYLAEYHAKADKEKINQVVSLGTAIYVGIGLIGGIVIVAAAPWLVGHVFKVPPALHDMATHAMRIGGVGFLLSQLQLYLQSIPQSLGRYDISARFEASFGMLIPILTVIVVVLGGDLVAVVLLRVAASVLNVGLLWRRIRQLLPDYRWLAPRAEITRTVLSFSGFAYLKRIASVTYTQADKLIIGALAGVQWLTFYVVAFTLVSRVFNMTFRISAVMFPTSSTLAARDEIDRLRRLYLVAVRYTVFLNGAIMILLVVLAHSLLTVWMGVDFAARSATVLALLAMAAFVDSLTNLPSMINDGLGYPKVTGLFAVSRAVMGASLAYVMVGQWGILGAAISQLVVAVVMVPIFLIYAHGRTIPITLSELFLQGYMPVLSSIIGVGLFGWWCRYELGSGFAGGLMTGCAMALLMGLLGYWVVLRQEEKAILRDWLLRRRLA